MKGREMRMYLVASIVVFYAIVMGFARLSCAEEIAEITVNLVTPGQKINPFIYGQFLEHILHSIDLGLHAEMLTERSFEYPGANPELHPLEGWTAMAGHWGEAEGKALQTDHSGIAAAVVGNKEWTDYDVEMDARKTSGAGNVWVLFRFTGEGASYIWDVGGPFGTTSAVSSRSGSSTRTIENKPMPEKPSEWRHVRIELRGNRIVCKLDGALIHDVEDRDHARGCLGVGFINASGEIRDVRVVSPKGDLLYKSSFCVLPPTEPGPDVGKAWTAVGFESGTVKAFRDAVNPLNSKHSLRLEIASGNSASVGIQQVNVPAQKGKGYVGYIYLRAEDFSGKAKVIWGNPDRTRVYADVPFVGFGADWRKIPFVLQPSATDANATIAFLFEGSGTVWLDQASLLSADVDQNLPLRKDIVDASAGLKPRIIRWPGGCFASIYYWKNGVGPVDKRATMPILDWDGVGGVDPNNFGTDEFIGFCRLVGAEPFIVINLAAGPEYAADWVEYCNGDVSTPMGAWRAQNGHPEPYDVKYWSIDNEQWAMDSHEYGRQARATVEAMLTRDPNLEFWLVGCYPGNEKFNVGVLEEAGKYCDYLSIHHYWGGLYEKVMASNLQMEDWFLKLDKQMKELVPDRKIWLGFDEWNPGGIDFTSGLASAAFLNSMERHSEIVGMSSPALWMRHYTISKNWNNALIQFDQTRRFVSPTYLAMRMYSERFAPERVTADVVCSGYNVEGRDGAVPYLDVVATRDPEDGRVVLKVVNRHKEKDIAARINLELPRRYRVSKKAEVVTLNADALDAANSLDNPERVKVVQSSIDNVSKKFEHVFPAHSVTVIVMKAAR